MYIVLSPGWTAISVEGRQQINKPSPASACVSLGIYLIKARAALAFYYTLLYRYL